MSYTPSPFLSTDVHTHTFPRSASLLPLLRALATPFLPHVHKRHVCTSSCVPALALYAILEAREDAFSEERSRSAESLHYQSYVRSIVTFISSLFSSTTGDRLETPINIYSQMIKYDILNVWEAHAHTPIIYRKDAITS